MQKLKLFILCGLVLCSGCSSVTESGLTKSELRDIKAVVAQQTTNTITGLMIPSADTIYVETAIEDGKSLEMFTLARAPEGWQITNRVVMFPVPPKN